MIQRLTIAGCMLAIVTLLKAAPVVAEPYLAIEEGYKCTSATSTDRRRPAAINLESPMAKVLLPAETLDNSLDAGLETSPTGCGVGGDLRTDWTRDTAPHTPSQQAFSLEQMRVYADSTIIPNKPESTSMSK